MQKLLIACVVASAATVIAAGCSNGGCRSQSECGSDESCVPPGVRRACGIPCPEQRDCESAEDCAPGQVCGEYVATCCFAGERSSRCQLPCTDASCAEGERCDATSGLCVTVLCDEGLACAPHTHCSPGSAGADEHGCVRDPCAGDGDCGDGGCVDGLCYDGPGSCEPPVP